MSHPYHHSSESPIQKMFDFAIPLILLYFYYQFYNFGKITPQEMIKTSGLWAIALLSLTLIIGPLCRFFPALDPLKAHRKVWGIIAFLAGLTHAVLIYIYYFKFDLFKFVDVSNPKYLGLLAGLIALAILAVVALTSNKKALTTLSPNVWKAIQTTAYLALILAVVHFYIVESTNGVLVIKRVVGQITFGFAAITILLRFLVMLLPARK